MTGSWELTYTIPSSISDHFYNPIRDRSLPPGSHTKSRARAGPTSPLTLQTSLPTHALLVFIS